MTALYAGLVVWLVTLILVEGEIFRPVRELLSGYVPAHWVDATPRFKISEYNRRPKLAYLVGCHLCTGTWVGLGVAFLIPGPLPHVVLNGLLYKAIGHVVLEVTALLKRAAA